MRRPARSGPRADEGKQSGPRTARRHRPSYSVERDDTMTTKMTAAEKKRKTLIQAATRKLLPSSKKRCPRCGKTKQITAFGWRTMESDSRGLPLVVRPQSHCAECRGA